MRHCIWAPVATYTCIYMELWKMNIISQQRRHQKWSTNLKDQGSNQQENLVFSCLQMWPTLTSSTSCLVRFLGLRLGLFIAPKCVKSQNQLPFHTVWYKDDKCNHFMWQHLKATTDSDSFWFQRPQKWQCLYLPPDTKPGCLKDWA